MTNAISVTIEIDGQPIPAEKVVWAMFGPCGCMIGATSHNGHTNDPTDLILTADQAMSHFSDVKAIEQRMRQDGQVCRPLTWDQYLADETFKIGCQHTPKWGIPTVTVPDGYEWATTDRGFGRRTFRKHLVPAAREARADTAALCKKVHWSWSNQSHHLTDTVTCRKCEQAVTNTQAAEVTE